jgi:hypothetical protein
MERLYGKRLGEEAGRFRKAAVPGWETADSQARNRNLFVTH